MILLMATWVLLSFSSQRAIRAQQQEQKTSNKRSKIRFTVEVIGSKSISAKEPILARILFTNSTTEPLMFSLGNDSQSYLHFSVRDQSGRLVGLLPPKQLEIGLHYGTMLKPKEQWAQVRSLSQWYRFDTPGAYSVDAQLLGGHPPRPVLENRFRLVVNPYNKRQLESRCLQLFAHIEPSFRALAQKVDGLDQRNAMQTLFSIQDDVALPYFDYLAKEYSSVEACLAIRRVKTKRAEQLIKALAARQDDVGEAARQALKLPLEEPKPEQATMTD